MNRGLILNVQGFRGDIKVKNSVIERNMVYIKEILLEPVRITKKFYDVDDDDDDDDDDSASRANVEVK